MRRVLAGFDRVLLGGQAERVVAHRVQHVVAGHALVAADDVGGGVAFRVADVQAGAARVGKHVEHVEFRLGGIEVRIARARGAEGFFGLPACLPLGLELAEGEWFAGVGHGRERARTVAGRPAFEKQNPVPLPTDHAPPPGIGPQNVFSFRRCPYQIMMRSHQDLVSASCAETPPGEGFEIRGVTGGVRGWGSCPPNQKPRRGAEAGRGGCSCVAEINRGPCSPAPRRDVGGSPRCWETGRRKSG